VFIFILTPLETALESAKWLWLLPHFRNKSIKNHHPQQLKPTPDGKSLGLVAL